MQEQSHPPPAEPRAAAIGAYAAGSFGTGVFQTVPSVLLLFYATEILHVAPGLAALAVFLPKAWGIVWDPLVGSWSDRTRTRFGRRRPYLIGGTLGLTVSFIAVFSAPALPPLAAFCWVAITYFALASLYSVFAVPYIALPAEVGATHVVRARMVSWRIAVAMIGVLAGAGLAPLIVAAGGGGRAGYAFMSLWIAGACALAMLAPLGLLRGRDNPGPANGQARPRIFRQILDAMRHRQFAALTLAYVLQLAAVGMISSAAPYLVTKALGHGEGDIGIAMLAMLSATTLTVPLWAWAGRRYGERPALAAASILFAASATLVGVLCHVPVRWPLALAGFAAAGIPFAGLQVLPFTAIAHLIHAEGQRGTPAEGAFTGILTASEKLGLALGPAFTGLALTAVHGDVPHGLTTAIMIGPAILALLSVPLVMQGAKRPHLPLTEAPR